MVLLSLFSILARGFVLLRCGGNANGSPDGEVRSDLALQRQKGTGWCGKEMRYEEGRIYHGSWISVVIAYKPLSNP